jgi:diguanylate cyclase (GGDEF)-like protein
MKVSLSVAKPKSIPTARARHMSSGVRAGTKLVLDAADLDALLELVRAPNAAEAHQRAARLQALLGNEAPHFAELVDALVARACESQQLRRMAGTDELTSIGNRRAFGETLRRELSRARRSKSALSIVLFDVDGLKAINDSLGHAGGDTALRSVARCLRQGTRDGDLVARIGGDEFAVVLPATGAETARVIGERIRAMVARVGISGMQLGVSLGVSETQSGDLDASALLGAADLALYRDKAAHRAERAAHTAAAKHN